MALFHIYIGSTLSVCILMNNLQSGWTVQEELAAVNLAKYRKAQSDLDEAEERLAENAAELSSRARLKNVMSASTTRPGGGVCHLCFLSVHCSFISDI